MHLGRFVHAPVSGLEFRHVIEFIIILLTIFEWISIQTLYNDFNAQVDAADVTQTAKYIKIFNNLQAELLSG